MLVILLKCPASPALPYSHPGGGPGSGSCPYGCSCFSCFSCCFSSCTFNSASFSSFSASFTFTSCSASSTFCSASFTSFSASCTPASVPHATAPNIEVKAAIKRMTIFLLMVLLWFSFYERQRVLDIFPDQQ